MINEAAEYDQTNLSKIKSKYNGGRGSNHDIEDSDDSFVESDSDGVSEVGSVALKVDELSSDDGDEMSRGRKKRKTPGALSDEDDDN
jgi:hypothetical protein